MDKSENKEVDDIDNETVLEVKVVSQPVIKEKEEDDDDGYLEIKLTKEEMEDEEVDG